MSDNAVKVRCGKCGHVFIVAYLPMPVEKAALAMKRATCPSCASTKPIYLAFEEAEQ